MSDVLLGNDVSPCFEGDPYTSVRLFLKKKRKEKEKIAFYWDLHGSFSHFKESYCLFIQVQEGQHISLLPGLPLFSFVQNSGIKCSMNS